jgi:hypothetical protein
MAPSGAWTSAAAGAQKASAAALTKIAAFARRCGILRITRRLKSTRDRAARYSRGRCRAN